MSAKGKRLLDAARRLEKLAIEAGIPAVVAIEISEDYYEIYGSSDPRFLFNASLEVADRSELMDLDLTNLEDQLNTD